VPWGEAYVEPKLREELRERLGGEGCLEERLGLCHTLCVGPYYPPGFIGKRGDGRVGLLRERNDLERMVFREIILPALRPAAEAITLPWIYHSDGDLTPILDDLLSLGMNALHPFATGAMDMAAVKELRETRRWLKLVHRVPLVESSEQLDALLAESDELIRIFVASIRTAEKRR